jgi:glycosyltransferase involved in cell wall biosynthesis
MEDVKKLAEAHTFAVPAFGEPKWIERCLDSIQNQRCRSRVLVTTSTPSAYLRSITERRGLRLIVNQESRGIAADWNFALTQADSEWVSLAHQDDWYEPDYVELCLRAASQAINPLMIFTDAIEKMEGDSRAVLNSRVKRALSSLTFLGRSSIQSRFRRRLLLAFGNPIPCPSVMINRRALPHFRFPEGWRSNLDWSAWLSLADAPGAFVRVAQPLVHRTLHARAETTQSLSDRAAEDDQMFHRLWPSPIALVLSRIYAASRRPYIRLRNQG